MFCTPVLEVTQTPATLLGGWAVGTGAVVPLGASVEDSVEGTVKGSSESAFGTSIEESVGGCFVGASVECEFIVLLLVISVKLLHVGPTYERILAKLHLFALYCTSYTPLNLFCAPDLQDNIMAYPNCSAGFISACLPVSNTIMKLPPPQCPHSMHGVYIH